MNQNTGLTFAVASSWLSEAGEPEPASLAAPAYR